MQLSLLVGVLGRSTNADGMCSVLLLQLLT
jgi:hypothetical protein